MTTALVAAFAFVALFFLTSAYFSGSETGFISLDRLALAHRVQAGDAQAARIERILAAPERFIGAALVGTNLSNVAATALFTYAVERLLMLHGRNLVVAMLGFSLALLLFGEIIPKLLFRAYPAKLIGASVGVFSRSMRLFAPASRALEAISRGLLRMVRFQVQANSVFVTREELLQALETTHDEGEIDTDERRMISRTFEFANTSAYEVMVPLVDVDALEAGAPVAQALELIKRRGHAHIPVYENRIDNIVGVLLAYDLLYREASPDDPVSSLMWAAEYVPETRKIDELLNELRVRRRGMAIVVDEYGAAVGIVTPEDIIEEIVGEIYDEYDGRVSLSLNDDGSITCPAKIEVDLFREQSGFDLPVGEYETLAGLILERSERIPRAGERFDIDGYVIEVLDADKRRIKQVRVSRSAS